MPKQPSPGGRDALRPRPGMTTIVIPCWNGLADTRRCLDAVVESTSEPFEVVVIDNGSTDGTARHVRSRRDRRIRVISHETNLGFARAVNRGLAEARGPYAVWLNNDCFVTPGWLGRLQDALERAPWIGAVGPMAATAAEACGVQVAAVKAPERARLRRYAAAWSLRHEGRAVWTHRLVGFCVLHRTRLLREIGFLDERFGLGCFEDFDWCLRARQAGYELYVAEDVLVVHRGRASFRRGGLPYARIYRENRGAFVDKWCRRGLQFLDELDHSLHKPRFRRPVR
ncbi:MAG: glycosyltransferase family 2 protein [Elusimicrobiota bacterium]